ncbi:TRAP transporter small permease [Pusillimonas sp. ANT_WB101]|uniref:TRAP transporter small permease n=1 Tax=Pusillimonas sp. ANT_WB101 TaxID=2597356 RepID=UPI00165EAA6E|nr:TRAP transporter small permease [Pusillimonas sp. ANT_WB101]
MRKILDTLYDGSLYLAGLFLVSLFAVMILEAVMRAFGSQVTGAGELVGWFCAAAGFLALPATFKRGDMVRVGVLLDAARPSLRKPLMLAGLLIATSFSVYMVWAAGKYLLDGWDSGELTQGMIELPVWIPQLSFLSGTVLLLLAVVDEFVSICMASASTLRAENTPSVEDAATHY